ncbi:unnamed protein product [Dibothriocephalus latus]|uniref:Helix-turn-helix domain-containing protein n=1 Tax=Dibothriocephalus latus TaxID=60516 RepID=A0A3P7PFE1_DIBLA|nr:unnamed protein product [Dibothriocephalus latus]
MQDLTVTSATATKYRMGRRTVIQLSPSSSLFSSTSVKTTLLLPPKVPLLRFPHGTRPIDHSGRCDRATVAERRNATDKPKFWARYVDDTFIAIERDQVLTFMERLNSVFRDIQLTMKEEENNQLTFLDVLVCHKDCGCLKTKAFRKVTNSMQVLNNNSNHLVSHKRSCVRTFYQRVETHCSEPEDKIAKVQFHTFIFDEAEILRKR